MKKMMALVLALVCVLGLISCKAGKKGSLENDEIYYCTFIVIEATEEHLLVAEIGENGKAINTNQYSVPNWFHPSTEIKEGYNITIKHSGVVLETYPMQFAEIISLEYLDRETGLSTVAIPD